MTETPTLPEGFEHLTPEQAQRRFNIEGVETIGRTFHDPILVHPGDLHLDGDLTETWIVESFFAGERARRQELLIIDGDLIVEGMLRLGDARTFPSLIVRGNLKCRVLDIRSSLTQVDGDLEITGAYHGFGHSGQLRVDGVGRTPVFLTRNHPDWFAFDPDVATVKINYYSEKDEYFDYDYSLPDIATIFDPALLPEGVDLSDDTDAYNFSTAVLERFRTGESPFRDGVLPPRAIERL